MNTTWRVPKAPADLTDRRCEITGPTDARMLINALNSGARVFMADFEDATRPPGPTSSTASANLTRGISRELTLTTPAEDVFAK